MTLVFLGKIFIVCICLIIIRGTLPRYRMDSVAYKVWKEWVIAWAIVLLLNTSVFILF